MTRLEFDIETKRTKEWPLWIFNFIIFIIGSMMWIPTGGIIGLFIFLTIWLALSYSMLMLYPYFNLSGKLIFNEMNLEIQGNSNRIALIPYNEIDCFKLNFTLRKGLYNRHIDLGNNNKVEIKAGAKTWTHFICIRNKKEEEKLKLAILKLYESKVKVDEAVFDKKTYGLNNLSYEQIQKFKAKYNLMSKNNT
jgi:hypothetical protein